MKRRNFIQNTALGGLGVVAGSTAVAGNLENTQNITFKPLPIDNCSILNLNRHRQRCLNSVQVMG